MRRRWVILEEERGTFVFLYRWAASPDRSSADLSEIVGPFRSPFTASLGLAWRTVLRR